MIKAIRSQDAKGIRKPAKFYQSTNHGFQIWGLSPVSWSHSGKHDNVLLLLDGWPDASGYEKQRWAISLFLSFLQQHMRTDDGEDSGSSWVMWRDNEGKTASSATDWILLKEGLRLVMSRWTEGSWMALHDSEKKCWNSYTGGARDPTGHLQKAS